MKKTIILVCLSSLLFSNELDVLNPEKKELRDLNNEIIKEDYKLSRDSWLSPINVNSSFERSHSFSSESDSYSRGIGLSYSQDIFKSGGIFETIEYAKKKLVSDLLAWEVENYTILQSVYENIFNILKTRLELEQSEYELKNASIELDLRKLEYDNGNVDIVELNDAIMSKNSVSKTKISLQSQLKTYELELSKYTDLSIEEIKMISFDNITKDLFLENNIDIKYEDSLISVLDVTYEKLKSSYLPQVALSTSLNYSKSKDMINDENNKNYNGSVGVSVSMPLYDPNRSSNIQRAKLDVLVQKSTLNDKKYETSKDYDEVILSIDTYEKTNKIIEENIKLYEDLIDVYTSSNESGITSDYDLDVLKNTKKINEYDIAINDVNIKLEYLALYFKIKGEK